MQEPDSSKIIKQIAVKIPIKDGKKRLEIAKEINQLAIMLIELKKNHESNSIRKSIN